MPEKIYPIRCNYIESLLGIETPDEILDPSRNTTVATILNPY